MGGLEGPVPESRLKQGTSGAILMQQERRRSPTASELASLQTAAEQTKSDHTSPSLTLQTHRW